MELLMFFFGAFTVITVLYIKNIPKTDKLKEKLEKQREEDEYYKELKSTMNYNEEIAYRERSE